MTIVKSLVAFLVLIAGPALAQDEKKPSTINKEDVSFKSIDGVLLKGTFYPSAKGGNSPVVHIAINPKMGVTATPCPL